MRALIHITMLLLAAAGAGAEIIDRIAVTVDRMVITESDILAHIRVAAFLNQEQPDTGPDGRKAAAERMVEQVLIRREMQISRYPSPGPEDVESLLQDMLQQRSLDDTAYDEALKASAITDEELRESLLLQLTLLRFIEYRFRPSVALDDEEVEAYYRDEFSPAWLREGSGPIPALDDVRGDIEELLIQDHVDVALDEWLDEAATQARIRYRQEAFE